MQSSWLIIKYSPWPVVVWVDIMETMDLHREAEIYWLKSYQSTIDSRPNESIQRIPWIIIIIINVFH